VKLEFAVVDAGEEGPPAGRAVIAREDYEGMDLRGESAKVRVFRGDAPGNLLDLELVPGRIPRRVIHLSAEDSSALGVEVAAADVGIMPREVPGLPAVAKVWVDDPGGSAPGADAFRWFFYASNPPWNATRHSLAAVRSIQRELPLTLRNVYAFFTIYANVDGFDPASDSARSGRRPAGERSLVDRWVLSELALTTRAVIEHMDGYRVYEATRALTDFVDALSNWYVRRNRNRFWAPGLGQDKLDVHWTLYECLVTTAKLVAPFLPFAADEMWQNLVRRPDPEGSEASVHLANYPEPDEAAIDVELSRVMGTVRELVSLGLQVRTLSRLRVRQPLEVAEIVLAAPELEAKLRGHIELIRDELNVHEVHFVPDATAYVTYRVKPNFRALGPKLGKRMPALKQALGQADGAELLRQLDADGVAEVTVDGETVRLSPDEIAVTPEAREGFSAASGAAGVVVLGTTLSDALVEEGLYREVLNRVQAFRKELDLEYSGRIRLTLAGAPQLLDAVRPRVDALAGETLAVEVSLDAEPPADAHVSEASIDGASLRLGLTLA